MYVVFLTGGLASGKGVISDYLQARGATILDADKIAKDAQTDQGILAQLQAAFGEDILNVDGMLDRRLLASRAFVDKQTVAKLNAICWPPVLAHLKEYISKKSSIAADLKINLLVVQIPLLAEAPHLLALADEVICVIADAKLRKMRAIERGMPTDDAERRLQLQATDAERVAIADTVFYNDGTVAELLDQVESWHSKLLTDKLKGGGELN